MPASPHQATSSLVFRELKANSRQSRQAEEASCLQTFTKSAFIKPALGGGGVGRFAGPYPAKYPSAPVKKR